MANQLTIPYLESLRAHGTRLGLDNVKKLLHAMGDPHLKFKSIHVAGTNGKGSVCAMLTQSLIDHGLRVGTYTSPHLVRLNERITIDRAEISSDGLKRYAKKVEDANIECTYFEALTAIAFSYFADAKVDIAVVEVGLGGRLDATNALTPLLSIITNIDLEHTEYLGESIEDIAQEKGGIIKPCIPVVLGQMDNRASDVLKSIAQERKSKVCMTESPISRNGTFDIGEIKDIDLSLKGAFQRNNAAIALRSLRELGENHGVKIDPATIRRSLSRTFWPGRFQFVRENILLDCAHNAAGARALKSELDRIGIRGYILVIGIMSDKNIDDMVNVLSIGAGEVIASRPDNPRSADPKMICHAAKRSSGAGCAIISNVRKAIETAIQRSKIGQLIVVAGSIYLIGEVVSYLGENKKQPIQKI